jgi:hypothetical protein
MIVIRTLTCGDGVIGLNGWRYLLNSDDTLMKFIDKETAKTFLKTHSINNDEMEFIDFVDESTGELENWISNS